MTVETKIKRILQARRETEKDLEKATKRFAETMYLLRENFRADGKIDAYFQADFRKEHARISFLKNHIIKLDRMIATA